MELAALAFYIFSFSLLTSAFFVVSSRNPVHSVFFLIFAFFNAAGLFILTGAEFLAMILVLVYVGAVAVLFLFVVMMLGGNVVSTNYGNTPQWTSFFKSSFQLLLFVSTVIVINYASLGLTSYINTQFKEGLSAFLSYLPNWTEFILTSHEIHAVTTLAISIIITKIFASKVLNISMHRVTKNFLRTVPLNWIATIFIFGELLVLSFLCKSSQIASEYVKYPHLGGNNTESLGLLIYTDYFYMFQIGGMILLLAMIGAISLTLHSQKSNVVRQDVTEQISRTKDDTLRINKVDIGKGVDV